MMRNSNVIKEDIMEIFTILSRLIAIFGISILFTASGWAATANSPTVNLACAPLSFDEGNSGTKAVTCTVSISESPSNKPIVVSIATTNGTATSGNDYVALISSYSFNNGTTTLSHSFTITVNGDTLTEGNENFTVVITPTAANPQNFTNGTLAQTITINNDDGSEINVLTVANGGTDTGYGNVLVASGTIDRTYTIENSGIGNLILGTVTATGDFSITAQPSATVTAGGSTTFTVRFDPSAEGARIGTVSFSNNDADENPYNFNVSGVGLVPKDYKLTVDSVVLSENAGMANINIRVDPAMQSGDSLQVNWATSDDTATGGFDYTASSGIVNITSTSSNFFTVTILDDLTPESQEIFNTAISNAIMISNPSNSTTTIATGAGAVTINDNDLVAGIPTLSITDRTLSEAGGNMVFTVTRSAVATSDVFFSYTTVDGTAWSSDDFTLTAGTGVISAGASSSTISVPINNDIMAGEGSEAFNVVLSNPSIGTQLGASIAVGTIIDDDTGLTLAISNAQIAENDSDISGIVRVYFSMPLPNNTSITYHTSNGTATEPNDYGALSQTVTVPSGSTFYDINVIITGDTAQELTEEFYVTLDSTTDGTIAKAQSKVTVFDNDGLGGCSSYVGMMTINEYQNNPNYQDPNHPLANNAGMVPGNYIEIKYLDFLVKQYMNNLWTISVVTKTGNSATKTWDQSDLQCPDPRYEVFEMDNNVMTAEGYVVIKDANGNEVDILNIDSPNNVAQQCQNFLYDTDFESSAQNKDLFREPDGIGDWFDHGNGANSGGSRCVNRDGASGEGLYTEFDAIDTDEPLPVSVINQLSVPIKTKIVNQPFNLTILDINTSTGYLIPVTVDIKAYLGDADTFLKLPGSGNIAIPASFSNSSTAPATGFNYDKAAKRTRIFFEYCEDNGITTNWNTCWNANTQADLDKRRTSLSRDTFAIRPDHFTSSISTTAPLSIYKAGKVENFIFRANDASSNPTDDYNETQNASFVVDLNVSDGNYCAVKNLTISPYVQFNEGIHNDDFSFNDVGDINMSIHEIIGNEFALTDNDDTPLDTRLITEHNVSFTVIPDHFNIEANLTDHNSDKNLTYLHDMHSFDSDDNYEMGAVLEANISAMHFDDINITRNYTELCYAKDTNLTLILNGTIVTYPGSTAPLTHFLYYNPVQDDGITLDAGEGNNSLLPVTNGMSISSLTIENNASSFPTDAPDGNGTTSIKYKLNFDRKQHLTVNPIQVLLSDVNITDTDIAKGTTGALSNQEATLYYTRSRASETFYDDETTASVPTPILIDVYCDLGFTACGNLGINTTNAQTNENDWWLSLGHTTSNNDGNITLIKGDVTEGTSADWSVSPDVNIIANAVDGAITVYRGTSPTLPLTVEINLDETNPTDTNHWLIYNPNSAIGTPAPFYKVRFIGESGWAGHGDTGHVVDSNVSTKKNRRLGW